MALSIRRAHSTDISTFACPTEKQRFFQLFCSKPSKLRFVISVVDDILRNIARFQPTLSTASSAGLISSNIPYDFAGSYYLRYEREERLGNVSGYSTSKFSEWKKKKRKAKCQSDRLSVQLSLIHPDFGILPATGQTAPGNTSPYFRKLVKTKGVQGR